MPTTCFRKVGTRARKDWSRSQILFEAEERCKGEFMRTRELLRVSLHLHNFAAAAVADVGLLWSHYNV